MTNRPSKHQPLTHQPPTQQLAESIIIFERLDNTIIFILKNTNTAGKTYNYALIYYLKSLLISIKHIWKSQLQIIFYFLNFIALLLPRYSKVTFQGWNFLLDQMHFFHFIMWVLYSLMRKFELPKQLFVVKASTISKYRFLIFWS